ncbi:sigma-70 family RNA polymerase sigma factor [Isosphaeraceae bacterium EP7]
MTTRYDGMIVRQLASLFEVGSFRELSDGQLLEQSLGDEREAAELAFGALVKRHGPMVLRVCCRVLADPHDAQDAFQATFLVLARRGRSIRRRESLASWLHEVALRVACCTRRANAVRQAHERLRAGQLVEAVVAPTDDSAEHATMLHEELARLPERYRAAVVLCALEGQTCEEAARRLGCPVGTIKSRLARARERLRLRLERRGLGTVGFAALLTAESARAAVPARLTAQLVAKAGRAGSSGVIQTAVAELTQEVLTLMLRDQLRYVAIGMLSLIVGVSGAVALARSPQSPAVAAASAPGQAEAPVADYVVEPPDLLVVEVLDALPGRPIKGDHLVRPDGTLSLGYYGDVFVAGLTLRQVKVAVIAKLRENLGDDQLGLIEPDGRHPSQNRVVSPEKSTRVLVDVSAYNSKFYYVQGDVGSPGRLPVTGNERVLDAINFAGGLNPSEAKRNIRLVRPASPGICCEQVFNVDLDAIVKAGDQSTNHRLGPGDRLVVYRDPVSETTVKGPSLEARFESIERRLDAIERRLERAVDLLEAAQPPRP